MNSPRNAPSGAAPSLNAKTLVFVFGPTAAFARGEADDRRWPDEIDAAFYSEMSSTAAEAIKAAATPEWGQPRIMSGHVGVGDHTCPCYRLAWSEPPTLLINYDARKANADKSIEAVLASVSLLFAAKWSRWYWEPN